jgi:hypothetical protein
VKSREERDGKEVRQMATYRIIRIYDVPADNQIQATNRMMEAIVLHVERDYHVMDYVKAPDDPKGKGWPVDLTPPKGWAQHDARGASHPGHGQKELEEARAVHG